MIGNSFVNWLTNSRSARFKRYAVRFRAVGLAALGVYACAGCALLAPEKMRAEVALSADCVPTGSYKLYSSRGDLQATGSFEGGQRNGVWTFWDSRGVRIVELTYVRGTEEGPCLMWYGSFAYLEAAGSKKLEGQFSRGKEDGMKSTWWPGGSLRCETQLNRGEVVTARCWSESGDVLTDPDALDAARSALEPDIEYLHTLERSVEDSVWDRCRDQGHAPGPLPREMLRQ